MIISLKVTIAKDRYSRYQDEVNKQIDIDLPDGCSIAGLGYFCEGTIEAARIDYLNMLEEKAAQEAEQ